MSLKFFRGGVPSFPEFPPHVVWKFIVMVRPCGDFFRDLAPCTRKRIRKSPRVKSCTRSLSSVNSSLDGGEKSLGCLVDAARLKATAQLLGLDLPIWRIVFVNTLGRFGDAIAYRDGESRGTDNGGLD
ncbi:MAG: hypothetical protein LQ338_007674 [Usnochroma carphineum]|nr:MAG: hypothetical protein LQ338_007674 [Usnochroma carphineum]